MSTATPVPGRGGSSEGTPTPTPATPAAPPLPVWRYVARTAPLVVLWVALVAWLGWLLYDRANWTREADEADLREWLTETRVFSKTLPELVREYVAILESSGGPDPERLRLKYEEIEEQLRAMAEPTRAFAGKLPLFPDVYLLAVECPNRPTPAGRGGHPLWRSPVPLPGADAESRSPSRGGDVNRVRELDYALYPADDAARRGVVVRCVYRLHTFNRLQRQQEERRRWQIPLVSFLVPATVVALVFVVRFLRRERAREVREWQARVDSEHRERELLAAQIRQQEAERATEELGRKLLEQELEAAKLHSRAAEAERAALEMKSQLYASIGIMAGSYAHNIKNLLVRPNDLLARCIEADGLSHEQEGMLAEVKTTLGTVTERLQQILRTVRRDPGNSEMTRVDLAALVLESRDTWAGMGREKWRLRVTAEVADSPLWVNGDLSHLQQAVENLLFNARDATFEMRNHLRDEVRRDTSLDPAARKQKLIDAAAWKGEVVIRARREGGAAVLEVADNGIGMTDEVRANCLKTHFTTKRDNALYEGYSAGMGLGLSFVAVVLEHHGATLEIDSTPLQGATFRVRLPLAAEEKTD